LCNYFSVIKKNIIFIVFVLLIIVSFNYLTDKKKPIKNEKFHKKTKKNVKTLDKNKKLEYNSIDINNTDTNQLVKINGIGEKKARKIMLYVKNRGRIYKIDELKNVDGIGVKTLKEIKKYCYVKF